MVELDAYRHLLTREPGKNDIRISTVLPLVPIFHLRRPLSWLCFLIQLNPGRDNNYAEAGTF